MRYSKLERLHFRVLRRWPQRVVDRRLDECDYRRFEGSLTGLREYEKFWGPRA